MEVIRASAGQRPRRRVPRPPASRARHAPAATSRAPTSSATSRSRVLTTTMDKAAELGARQRAVPGHVRPGLLRDRDDVDRRRARRHRALRLRGLPRLPAPGRPADHLGPDLDQDGAGRPAHLRPDARAASGRSRWAPAPPRWASSTTTRSSRPTSSCRSTSTCPAARPAPRPSMHGILKLRTMIQGKPDLGWRDALRRPRHRGGRSASRRRGRAARDNISGGGRAATVPDATGLELIAGELREARGDDAVARHRRTSATRRALDVAPARCAAALEHLRAQGLHLPRLRARRRLLPRGAAPRRALRAARHGQRRPHHGQDARAHSTPRRCPSVST